MTDMSDIEDDLDDELEFEEYFYVEDTYDEVGELAEHAVASPPPFDDGEDMWDWDRFAYWNDIEYDSDGYHDVDLDRVAKRKRKGAQPPPKGKLKRRLETAETAPAKRRKGRAGASHEVNDDHQLPQILVSPIGWKEGDEPGTPLREVQEEPFALLKDWRAQFPEGDDEHDGDLAVGEGSSADRDSQPTHVEEGAILAALRANLGKLTTGPGTENPGADEELLMRHISKMLAGEGASLDDIAGSLADALFAPDDDQTSSDSQQAKAGDGDFGQWVLTQAEEQVGAGQGAAKGQQHSSRELSPPVDGTLEHATTGSQTPAPAVPPERRPPTPASAEGGSGTSQQSVALPATTAAAAGPAAPRSRKRKAASGAGGEGETEAPPKRSATRSFDAPTASSRARSGRSSNKETMTGAASGRRTSKR